MENFEQIMSGGINGLLLVLLVLAIVLAAADFGCARSKNTTGWLSFSSGASAPCAGLV